MDLELPRGSSILIVVETRFGHHSYSLFVRHLAAIRRYYYYEFMTARGSAVANGNSVSR